MSRPTWANHRGIFGDAGHDLAEYAYYDANTRAVDFGQMCEVDAALPGTLHLIARYEESLADGLIENVRAGGDSAGKFTLLVDARRPSVSSGSGTRIAGCDGVGSGSGNKPGIAN